MVEYKFESVNQVPAVSYQVVRLQVVKLKTEKLQTEIWHLTN